jgi:DMSO reductase family type II enzyme molybdopterin subunit
VSITPDLSASAIHTDLWVPVNVGSDAALGLSLAQVILEEELHDAAFIREQTDLPLLVRRDTRRFLRASDLEEEGKEHEFFVFDLASDGPRTVQKETLALEGLEPALEGDFQLATRQGPVTVTPVLNLLREHLKSYTPELAAEITGTSPDLIRSLARQIARARAATILTQSNFGKFYHGMEMQRAQFLVLALCGHFGRKGSGLNAFPFLSIDGNMPVALAPPPLPDLGALISAVMDGLRPKQGETTEMFYLRMSREMYTSGTFVSSSLFLHTHAGLAPLTGSSRRWDPHLKRDADEYLSEAIDKGWQLRPPEPRMLLEVGGNLLRRARGHDRLIEGLLPKLSLLVTFDWRLSTTALHSDYVLPAAGWYERDDIVWATPIVPFAQATTKAVEPVAESKQDWEFHCLLLKAIQQRAIARGEKTFTNHAGEEQRLDDVFDDFTFRGLVSEDDPERLLKAILFVSSNLEGTNWDELKQQGHARFTGLGRSPINITNATDIEPNQTITANMWHTENKMPWPTLTRRMQFYIDHDSYLELGEELPTHKDAPPIGGDHPLQMTSGHARWSIHSMWRDHPLMLSLQRGEPVVLLNQRDAESRGIREDDRVRVRNDIGAFELRAKLSPTIRPGQIVVYHAWEPFQFANHRSYQAVTPSPLNPIEMAGGYYHLQPYLTVGQPGMNDRGTRAEVEKV